VGGGGGGGWELGGGGGGWGRVREMPTMDGARSIVRASKILGTCNRS